MPKQPKYSESSIYKLCCKDPTIKEVYVGSTTNFRQRKRQHKHTCNNASAARHDSPVYKYIREHGNWENWDMIEIEKYNAKDKRDLERKEREHLERLGATLNKGVPTQTYPEWLEKNKDIIKTKQKTYREKNKNVIKVRKQKYYYEKNKTCIRRKQMVYNEKNKETNREIGKAYRQNNRDKIRQLKSEKIVCDCGITCTRGHKKSRHFWTKRQLAGLGLRGKSVGDALSFAL